jgi:hypothetical protein
MGDVIESSLNVISGNPCGLVKMSKGTPEPGKASPVARVGFAVPTWGTPEDAAADAEEGGGRGN